MDDFDARTDEHTEQLAAELYRRVRELNNSTQGRQGLERPETAYTVLGNLAQASFGLAQTAEQLDAFLDRELSAGRLGHERGGGLVPIIVLAHDALQRAHEYAAELGDSFRRAQGALTSVHSTVDGETQALDNAEEADATVVDQAASDIEPAANDFPTSIGEALSRQGRADLIQHFQRPPAPKAPRPRREP
ncbi:hypothetical protein BJF79_08710 [Actinomadura sp. CNU-125]|uniref:hypothetical protein n=1 Tax=Actinomadura sp. CNU-125 TaxID=1904961 RepID=UPI000967E42E|nr:hypothetical protein [Actinomadura sp. CNU-125]OLT31865.1 hypothetical protein BJF79_08710 [Actinomadura sp. CNU-125]